MRVKLISSRIVDGVRESNYQDINTGRTWTIYQTIENSNVITLDSVIKAMEEHDAKVDNLIRNYTMDDIPF